MKKWILAFFLLAGSIAANAQTGFYYTYQDYLNDSIQSMSDISRVGHTLGRVNIIFENNKGKEEKVKASAMWGFMYKGHLFRSDKFGSVAMVVVQDSFIYYENGLAHLDMLRYNLKEGNFSAGYACYLSKDLGSEMCPVPSAPMSDARKLYKKFKEDHPQYAELFECIGKKTNYEHVRFCVQKNRRKS